MLKTVKLLHSPFDIVSESVPGRFRDGSEPVIKPRDKFQNDRGLRWKIFHSDSIFGIP